MNRLLSTPLLASLLFVGASASALAQTSIILQQDTTQRPITTAVPFLAIAPDARSAGMGDAGVAISPDVNAIYWNPAKLAFIDQKYGFSLSYSPWLRNLVDDMHLSYLSGFYKLDERQAFGASLRYFDLGDIQFTDNNGGIITDFNPREFAFDVTYSRKLSEKIGVAVSGRFIHSNLSSNLTLPNTQESRPGTTGAADVAFFYTNDNLQIGGRPSILAFGLNISNIGAKISYTSQNEQDFIPTNLRFGSALTLALDPLERNKITIALDLNKLLVPTPPRLDSQGNIIEGEDPRDKTLLSGIFGSFSDAPDGFSEELQEFTISAGAEYKYHNQEGKDVFAARAGYFYEAENKGDRKFFTVGVGLKALKNFAFDVAYLIPGNQRQGNPLAETLRFTLAINFDQKTERVYEGPESR
ncbi:MAG: type IX secretion system outer membrane channel protein PorV [Microscillaceae bacterium]